MATVEAFNPGLHSDEGGVPTACAEAGCTTTPEFSVAKEGGAIAACSRHLAKAVRLVEAMPERS